MEGDVHMLIAICGEFDLQRKFRINKSHFANFAEDTVARTLSNVCSLAYGGACSIADVTIFDPVHSSTQITVTCLQQALN